MSTEPILTLHKAYAPAPDIKPAEKGAAGTMPAAAFQYCEAMRRAASTGWYVYPPKEMSLYFDGYESFIHDDGDWIPIKSLPFEQAFRDRWNASAPEHLKGFDPPFVSDLFVPGAVQIWSGYFVQTRPGWSLHVRGPVNFGARSAITHYEGIVDTDDYAPSPLFINFKIVKTDVEVHLPTGRPLFQVMPVYRAQDPRSAHSFATHDIFASDADFAWEAMGRTIRPVEKGPDDRPGRYAAERRRRKE
ncbi:hypothetical protein LX81_03656 [Palleronia aestuarii]|uniref:Uncharacterized protein n=1 Tax=Palleronia aestuarii TaxID=568105 RepID=A0A2W7PS41_9RHOB|nr:DUF6065 family protein [Palleronia aestuarii]PZX12249.1 hypothetical protein LX81_03656 [Palleronia aestuarii]